LKDGSVGTKWHSDDVVQWWAAIICPNKDRDNGNDDFHSWELSDRAMDGPCDPRKAPIDDGLSLFGVYKVLAWWLFDNDDGSDATRDEAGRKREIVRKVAEKMITRGALGKRP